MNPYRFSNANYQSSEPLRVPSESIGRRAEFMQNVRSRPSPMFRSAVDSIDAAIALLAIGQAGQSCLLFSQVTEVSLKAVLDEVQRLGVAAWAAMNPALFRGIAAANRSIDSTGSIKEMTLIAAFRAVAEFVGFSDDVRAPINRINTMRNDLAHRGSESDQTDQYLRLILFSVLPLLDELYELAMGLHLADFVLHDIARELIVAARFLARRAGDRECGPLATAPFRAAYRHRWHNTFGIPLDFGVDDWDERYPDYLRSDWEAHVARQFRAELRGAYVLDELSMSCHICDEQCWLASDGELKCDNDSRYLEVSAIACPYCHLSVPEGYADLATIHYGRIDETLLGPEVWARLLKDFGHAPSTPAPSAATQ